MNWVYLGIAGLLEIAWAIGLKYTEGWTKLVPSLITAVLLIASFYFLSLAVRSLPIGTAYAAVHGSWDGPGLEGLWPVDMFIWFRVHHYVEGQLSPGVMMKGRIEVEL